VGYEEAFQRELCTKFRTWVAPPMKQKKGKKTSKKTPKASASAASGVVRLGKRKQADRELSDDGSEPDLDDDEEENAAEVVYRPRGTKSRPRRRG
jgi:hypothetical protein